MVCLFCFISPPLSVFSSCGSFHPCSRLWWLSFSPCLLLQVWIVFSLCMLCGLRKLFLVSRFGFDFSMVCFHSPSLSSCFSSFLLSLVQVCRALWFFAGIGTFSVVVQFIRCFLPLSWWLCFLCFRHVSSSFVVTMAFRCYSSSDPFSLFFALVLDRPPLCSRDFFVSNLSFYPFYDICLFWSRQSLVR